MKRRFEIENPDVILSPFTGMTKQHYVECAKYLLERAFSHVDSMEDPIGFPVVAGKTYPQPGAPDWRYRSATFPIRPISSHASSAGCSKHSC